MMTAEQCLAGQVAELNQASTDHMDSLKAIFRAIKKVSADDPVLAAHLAGVGVYLAELAEGDFDTIGMQIERVGKEIH
jgi:phosphoribosylformylglycinamidine (FGAM) synthase-like enzyme